MKRLRVARRGTVSLSRHQGAAPESTSMVEEPSLNLRVERCGKVYQVASMRLQSANEREIMSRTILHVYTHQVDLPSCRRPPRVPRNPLQEMRASAPQAVEFPMPRGDATTRSRRRSHSLVSFDHYRCPAQQTPCLTTIIFIFNLFSNVPPPRLKT